MKTINQFQEALIARVSKDKKNSGIPQSVLDANPNLNPNKPADYIKLKRMTPPVDTAMKTEEAMAAPTNNASSGNIAGLPPDDPPVKKNKRGSGMKNRKKKKYAYGGKGSRKMWMA